ncbi:MAG: Membrane-bound lytic murein transglycosylase precursor [Pseudomonadota bacterium]|jgi:membrane-bound lytic murein transglycosylase D
MKPFPLLVLVALILLSGCATTQTSQIDKSAPVSNAIAENVEKSNPIGTSGSDELAKKAQQQEVLPATSPPPETLIGATPAYDNLIDRIRSGFAMPDMPSSRIQPFIKRFSSNPDYLNRVFARGGPYLHHIVEEIEARGLPMELALLPIVESAYNPQATSHAKAAGLWQFIPSTGRVYELSQDWWMDERRDVIESTRAALDYLEKIYALHDNDWFLALASYNWGEGAVGRAVRRNKAAGKPADYLNLRMPRETRNYVPQLIALRDILESPQDFGLTLPYVENRPYFAVIDKSQSIDLKLAAELAELAPQDFQALNPHLRRPVIEISRTNRIVLPVENVDRFNTNLADYLTKGLPLVTWKPYTMKRGDSLKSIAARAGVSADDLAKANSLKNGKVNLLPGTVLLAPVAAQARNDASLETTLASFKGARTIEREYVPAKTYVVRRNETWQSIAKRWRVRVADLKALNRGVAQLKEGVRLILKPETSRTVITEANGKRIYER